MNKNINILATLVLIFGLMAPTGIQAGFWESFWNFGGAGAGATLGHRAANGAADEIGEMIPKNYRKPLIVIGAVAVVAYLIYANREESSAKNNARRAKSCPHKNCSRNDCK